MSKKIGTLAYRGNSIIHGRNWHSPSNLWNTVMSHCALLLLTSVWSISLNRWHYSLITISRPVWVVISSDRIQLHLEINWSWLGFGVYRPTTWAYNSSFLKISWWSDIKKSLAFSDLPSLHPLFLSTLSTIFLLSYHYSIFEFLGPLNSVFFSVCSYLHLAPEVILHTDFLS